MPRAAALVLAGLAAACATGPRGESGPRVEDFAVDGARFRLEYQPDDARAARQVRAAIEAAAPRASRWGVLRVPVTVMVHPTHAALERAIRRTGYDWLVAWAQFERIDVQSPCTWGLLCASDREVDELLAHELTHVAMFQLAGGEQDWMYKEIPRWFSEGVASVSADQGYRRGRVAELWRYYEDELPGAGDGFPGARARAARGPGSPVGDPLVDPDPLYQEQSKLVYLAAHRAVEFLLARYGEARVHAIVQHMGDGRRFPGAFKEAIGISDAEFAAEFRRYVVWQGWRRE